MELSEKVVSMIDLLCTKLNTTSEKLFSVLVKQAVINSWICIFINLLMIIVSIISVCLNIHLMSNKSYQENFGYYFFAASILLSLITFINIILSLNKIITGFKNPQYIAIQEISTRLQ